MSVLTPKFRVSFPNVFEPKPAYEGQKPSFNIQMLFPKDLDIKVLKAEAHRALVEKWGDDKKKWPKGLRTPFRDGDEKEYESHKDHTFVNCKTFHRPGIVDQQKSEIISEEDFYAGCYARATVNAYAYDTKGNRGVAFGLNNIQKLADGEKFSGGTSAEDDFGTVAVTDEDFDTSTEKDDDFDNDDEL